MSKTTFRAAVTMRLAACSCNPAPGASQHHGMLSCARPCQMRFVIAGCKPAKHGPRKSPNVRAALAMGTILRCPIPSIFLRFFSEIDHLTKSAPPKPTILFNILKCKPSSCYNPARFLSTTFLDRAPHLRKQRPYCGDPKSHFTQKNTGLRARVPFHPLSHARAIDMMMT